MNTLQSVLKLLFVSLFLKLSLISCDISSFQNDCITHCELRHPRRGAPYPVADAPTHQKYTTDDVSFGACKQRCRLAEVVRPKKETETYSI